jgi:hypothetical protein
MINLLIIIPSYAMYKYECFVFKNFESKEQNIKKSNLNESKEQDINELKESNINELIKKIELTEQIKELNKNHELNITTLNKEYEFNLNKLINKL